MALGIKVASSIADGQEPLVLVALTEDTDEGTVTNSHVRGFPPGMALTLARTIIEAATAVKPAWDAWAETITPGEC